MFGYSHIACWKRLTPIIPCQQLKAHSKKYIDLMIVDLTSWGYLIQMQHQMVLHIGV